MTTVTAALEEVLGAPARGYLLFTPTTAWNQPSDLGNLPLPKRAKLVNGATSVELDPTGPGWAWAVTYQVLGLEHWIEYYVVPDTGTVNLDALTEVDIRTLTPTSEAPDPSWFAYVDSVVAGQVGRVVVVTGTEERPGFASVFWIGGTTQPTNMAENSDVWFKAT